MGWIYFIATKCQVKNENLNLPQRNVFTQLILIQKCTEKWVCIEITLNLRQ